MNEYPYIKDKELYKATLFACKLLKEGEHSFTKSVEIASRYYSVSEESVSEEVRKRNAVSRRTFKKEPFKYKWFLVRTVTGTEANGEFTEEVKIKKAKTKLNACNNYEQFNRRNDYGGSYAQYKYDSVIAEYETLSDAKAALLDLKTVQG